MVVELQKGALLALHLGRRRTPEPCTPVQISLGKLNNVREAIAIARDARTILGGNGVLLEHSPIRHAANLESVRTYEGTDEVHTLILGRAPDGHRRVPLTSGCRHRRGIRCAHRGIR